MQIFGTGNNEASYEVASLPFMGDSYSYLVSSISQNLSWQYNNS